MSGCVCSLVLWAREALTCMEDPESKTYNYQVYLYLYLDYITLPPLDL